MRRVLAALFVVLLAAPSAAVAVPDARLAVSGLTVAPDTPAVGEPVTVTATVRNSAGSPAAVEVTEVRLVNRDGNTTLATAAGPGSLSPGDTLTVDLTRAFRTAGIHELAVVVVGEDADGDRVSVRRPTTVVVESSRPLVTVDADAVAGVESTLRVAVANPNTAAYRSVVVRVDPEGVAPTRRVVAALPAGASTTLNVSYTPPAAGEARVDVTVAYTTATGVARTAARAATVAVEPLREDVGVAVEPAAEPQVQADAAGGLGGLVGGATGDTLQQDDGRTEPTDALAVTVTNFGNAPLTDAVVVPRTDERRLPRVAVGRLAPGASRTVEVSLASVDRPTDVTATVRYATGDRTGTATGRFDYRPPTGAVRLTGVDVVVTDGTATVTGNAGNVGDGAVTGVVVRLLPAEGVEPAYPSRDYFVGRVEPSGFAPFELTAAVTANATAIPVEVTYRVHGEPVTRTVEFPVEGVTTPTEGGSNSTVAGLAGLGVALAAGGVVLVARRRR